MLSTLGNQILSKHIYDKNCCSSSLTAGPRQSVMKQACSLCLLCCHLTVRRLPWWFFPNSFFVGGKLQGSGLVTVFLRFCSHTIEGQCVIPLIKNVPVGKARDYLGWGNGNLFNLHRTTWRCSLFVVKCWRLPSQGTVKHLDSVCLERVLEDVKERDLCWEELVAFLEHLSGDRQGLHMFCASPLNPHNHLEYYHSLRFQFVEIQPDPAHNSGLCPLKVTLSCHTTSWLWNLSGEVSMFLLLFL